MENNLAPWRTTAAAAASIAVANLVVLGLGHLAGADLRVAQTAGATVTAVGVGSVLVASIAPTLFGGLALWLAARRGIRAWRVVGWLGLVLGVLTILMPVTVQASTGTTLTLASMHVVAGVVWFLAVRRAAAVAARDHEHERPVAEVVHAP